MKPKDIVLHKKMPRKLHNSLFFVQALWGEHTIGMLFGSVFTQLSQLATSDTLEYIDAQDESESNEVFGFQHEPFWEQV